MWKKSTIFYANRGNFAVVPMVMAKLAVFMRCAPKALACAGRIAVL